MLACMVRAIAALAALAAFSSCALAADLAGRYKGDWTGSAANGGFSISLEAAAGGAWKCEVTFTLADAEVKTKVTMVRVEGAEIEARYEFDLGGNKLQSTLKGRLVENRLEGKYQTIALANNSPVDEGEWKATRATP